MRNNVLLVVDVQTSLIKGQPYNGETVVENIKSLISAARDFNTEVLYVRHDGGPGDALEYGTDGWQIFHAVAPKEDEKIFEKRYSSSFFKTGLNEYLQSKNVETIILTGLQTEYCIDATLKSAFDNGYKVIIPEQTNTTFDNEYLPGDKLYELYNLKLWNGRFASVLPMHEVGKLLTENCSK